MKRWLLALLILALVAIVWRVEPWGNGKQDEAEERKATRMERSDERSAERRRRHIAVDPLEKEGLAMVMAALQVKGGMEVDWDPIPALQAVKELSLGSIRVLVDKVEEQIASGDGRMLQNAWWCVFTAGIWERYSTLAPEEAIERAFARPPHAPTVDGGAEDMLVRSAAIRGAAFSDPERVRAFLLDPPEGTDLSDMWNWEAVFERLAGHSTEGLFQVVQAMPRSTAEEMYRVYARALGEGTDWAREGDMLLEWRAGKTLLNVMLAPQLASQWARHDPQEALEWVAGNSDGSGRDVITTLHLWTGADPVGAAAWLKDWQAPVGMRKDEMISGVIQQHMGEDAAQTQALLGLVTDVEARSAEVIRAMKNASPDAGFDPEALEWMAGSPLLSAEAQSAVKERMAEIEAGEE